METMKVETMKVETMKVEKFVFVHNTWPIVDRREKKAGGPGELPDGAAVFAIAVIGMAGRFPGAGNIDEFRENLWKGVESITFFTREQFLEAGGDPGLVDDPGYVKAKGVLEADDYFDAAFFGYTPREAAVMDPQMRLFHECTWEALENAGYDPGSYNGLIGLYAGATQNPYWEILPLITTGPGNSFSSQWETVQFSDKDYLCARVSYKLNLKGPALTIQTACSTSLAAIDLACSQLLSGRCDMALAGGVSVTFQDRTGYPYQEGMIMSPDGHCRAFDAGAGGTVGGNGVGIVVLKPLAAAIRDGDFIHAVIKGSAANNDGTRKVGFTAPSVEGQVEVIRAAQRAAGVEPRSIGYIEAHGTGTLLGDPIEIEALKQVFHTSKRRFCAVGSVKTNVGHLDAAAGAAGFIKAVLAVKHGVIPPSLNFSEPNPAIDFENSPFYVNTVLKEWPSAGTPRRAGVSSFGIGGTNVHVILEEAPVMGQSSSAISKSEGEHQLIVLSARTQSALDTMAQNLVDYLRKNPGVNLGDIAYTLQVGRKCFPYRRAAVCTGVEQAVETLSGASAPALLQDEQVSPVREVNADFLKDLRENAADEGEFLEKIGTLWLGGTSVDWAGLHTRQKRYRVPLPAYPFARERYLPPPGIFKPRGQFLPGISKWSAVPVWKQSRLPAPGIDAYSSRDTWLVFEDETGLGTGLLKRLKAHDQDVAAVRPGGKFKKENHEIETYTVNSREQGDYETLLEAIHNGGKMPAKVVNLWSVNGIKKDRQLGFYGLIHLVRALAAKNFSGPLQIYVISDHVQEVLGGESIYAGKARVLGPVREIPLEYPHINCRSIDIVSPLSFGGIEPEQLLDRLMEEFIAGSHDGMIAYRGNYRWVQTFEPLPAEPPPQPEPLPAVEPRSGHRRPRMTTPYVPPSNEQETQLAKLFREFFGFEKVGIHDDFFELGGDSLKAMTFLANIRKTLRLDIPLPEFFNKSTVKELAVYIHQRAGKEKTGKGKKARVPITPVERKEYYALSSSQKRLYILQQMEKDNIGYNMPTVMELEGAVDVDRFEEVFLMLLDRHESLRTSFKMLNGEPVQEIHETVEFEIRRMSISAGGERHERHISEFIRPFELSKAPLLRAGLIKIDEGGKKQTHILMVDIHHIVTDGMSNVILIKDFIDGYQGRELSPLAFQYKDYAAWQGSRDGRKMVGRQEKYWLREFAGEIPVLNMPLDYERPAVQSFEGSSVKLEIGREESGALNHLASKQGVTLYMVLLTLYNILLSKLSGQEDIVMGTPVGGRWHADLQQVMGAFVNTLALRNFPGNDRTFSGFLREVKERTLEVFENRDYPFEDLVERVAAARDISRNPLFDVMFALQKLELSPGELPGEKAPGIKLRPYEYEDRTSKFDLTLTAYEIGETLSFTFQYVTKLFKRETVERFSRYFKELIVSAVGCPGMRLREMDMLPEEEKRRVLVEFNGTGTDYPTGKTIHQLIAEQVARSPGHTAVIGVGQRQITYSELNRKSGQLAHVLRERGVKSGSIVGIMAERSVEMLVGLLGILKSGAAYLPIDPRFPRERIKYMLAHSNAGILVSAVSEVSEVSEVSGGTPVIDLPSLIIENEDAEPAHPAHICYVIYTSGSTGSPKGVMVTHRSAVNFIAGMTAVIDFSPGKRILALTTISFDIFFLETLLPLTLGLNVVVADENRQTDPKLLGDLIIKHKIDMMQVTPSRLKLFFDFNEDLVSLKGVGELLVGGEAFPVNLFTRVREKFSGRIYNMYGPTETTIWSSVKELTEALPEELTIGTPIANTQVYIVDRHMHIQPLMVAGELLIGGDGAAAGYLNNVELTAEKFVFSSYRSYGSYRTYSLYFSKKLYKTGDLARWLSHGEIEFLGRLDQQVKIRGYRIELEEIEELLVKHEGVQAAVLVAKGNSTGDKYLAAYVVYGEAGAGGIGGVPTTTELREYLARRLPHYMVPSYFIPVDKMPLTPNGKIDRKALPEPDQSRPDLGATYVAPGTEKEEAVTNIWKQVLELERVGIYDNFFELGGNSLNIIQLSDQLTKVFKKDIPVAILFKYLTIRSFVDYVIGEEQELDSSNYRVNRRSEIMRSRKRFKQRLSRRVGGIA